MKSKLFKLNLRDLGRGLLTAVLAAIAAWVYSALQAGNSIFDIDWSLLPQAALSAAAGYIALNFGTNSGGKILTPEK